MKRLALRRHFSALALSTVFWVALVHAARRAWSDGTEFFIQFPASGAVYGAVLVSTVFGASPTEKVRFVLFSIALSVLCPLLAILGAAFGATIIVILLAPAVYLELVKKILLPPLPRISYLVATGFCFGSFFFVVALGSMAGYAIAPVWWLSVSLAIAVCAYERESGKQSIQADGPGSGESAA